MSFVVSQSDYWITLQAVLTQDLEIWGELSSQLETALKKESNIANRRQLQGTLAPVLIYKEVTQHYLEIMDGIEKGTYDGGTEES